MDKEQFKYKLIHGDKYCAKHNTIDVCSCKFNKMSELMEEASSYEDFRKIEDAYPEVIEFVNRPPAPNNYGRIRSWIYHTHIAFKKAFKLVKQDYDAEKQGRNG